MMKIVGMIAAAQAMNVMITKTSQCLASLRRRNGSVSIMSRVLLFLSLFTFVLIAVPALVYAQEEEAIEQSEQETPPAPKEEAIEQSEQETPPAPKEEAIEQSDEEAAPAEEEEIKIIPPDWGGTIALVGGWLNNKTTVNFKTPQKGTDTFTRRKLTLTGDGWGGGLILVGFYKWLTLVNVFYFFPNVNDTMMWGNITQLGASIPTGTFVEPYIGMGFAYVGTSTNLTDFEYPSQDHMDGVPTFGYAYFPKFEVDTRNLEPLPKVGVTFKLPIQHWYARPYYEFLYENLYAHARTPGGVVDVYRRPDGFYEYPIDVQFDEGKTTEYMSNVVGIDFAIDYNFFLRLEGNVNYNITHNLTSTRLIATVLFSRYVGFSAFFEYQDMIMVDNIYVMAGPSFLFMPSEFMDSVEAKKEAAMKKREEEKRARE